MQPLCPRLPTFLTAGSWVRACKVPGFQFSRVAGFQSRLQGSRPVQKDAGRADQNIDGSGVMQVSFCLVLGLRSFLGSNKKLLLGICHLGLFEDCDDCDAPSGGTMSFPTAAVHDLAPLTTFGDRPVPKSEMVPGFNADKSRSAYGGFPKWGYPKMDDL